MNAADAPAPPGPLDRFDPRARLLVLLASTFTVLALDSLTLLVWILVLVVAAALSLGIGAGLLARRLLGLEAFMLVLLVTLPFTTPGQPWFSLGAFSASREGLVLALGILLKANAVVLLVTTLLGSLSPVSLGHALARLGAPEKLVHLLLFTVRYIDVLQREVARSRQALRARAFVPRVDRRTWRTFGWFIGMLLVRSAERAARVLAAMRCRGFDGRLYLLDDTRWQAMDTGLLGLACLLSGALLVFDGIP